MEKEEVIDWMLTVKHFCDGELIEIAVKPTCFSRGI